MGLGRSATYWDVTERVAQKAGAGETAGRTDVLPSLAPPSVCTWPMVAAGARLPSSKPQVTAHRHRISGQTLPLCTAACL